MQNAQAVLERLLTKGKLEAAIEASLILCRHYGDETRMSMVVQHSARFHTLMSEQTAGTLDEDDYRPERARINRDMFEFIQDLPTVWTDEALIAANFSAAAFEQTVTPDQPKSPGKLALVAGFVVVLLVVLGMILKDNISPPKVEPKISQQEQETIPDKPSAQIPSSTPPNSSAKDPIGSESKFRSFGKSTIVEDMELGYVGQKLAFKNVRTLEILCCYADAKVFKGGKAYVSEDGVKYFYIDKRGKVVK